MTTPFKPRRVYALPDTLTPEMVAVALAKTSRSPDSFETNAGLLTEEKAATFHDKYVLGFGHGSVAELAGTHVCIEGISMLAAKALEDGRLGSYVEQSTRYQVWDRTAWLMPPDMEYGGKCSPTPEGFAHSDAIMGLRQRYKDSCFGLFDTYLELMPLVQGKLMDKYPRHVGMKPELYAANIKARACDLLRGLLPAAAKANVGFVANARTMEHTISKLMSHPLEEMVHLGMDILEVAKAKLPTLIKYANLDDYRMTQHLLWQTHAQALAPRTRSTYHGSESVRFTEPLDMRDQHVETLAQALYPHTDLPYETIVFRLDKLDNFQLTELWHDLFKGRAPNDGPPRTLETAPFTFELVLDFGAWRDLQRHRMMTQFDQVLAPYLGYEVPEEITGFGFADRYREALAHIPQLYQDLADETTVHVAQYCVPMCFKKRALFRMNLRELHALVELRTRPGGHLNYRRIARQMFELVEERYPLLVSELRAHEVVQADALKRIKETKD